MGSSHAESRPLSTSQQLGPFSIVGRLGAGGGGVVWAAEHRDGTPVAIKTITAQRGETHGRSAAFHREIQHGARLRHAGIVTILDHGDLPEGLVPPGEARPLPAGSPYLLMERAQGTLGERWARGGAWTWPQLRGVLEQLLRALAAAHAHGVVHRDIKPANVLAFPQGRYKLADFGLSALFDRGGEFQRAGTPTYMAPEQFHGLRPGPPSDLYSLGCVAWSLVEGRPPFVPAADLKGDASQRQAAWAQLARAHREARLPELDPTRRCPLPQDYEAWLARLLAKLPHHRYARAADALDALRHLGTARAPRHAPAPRPPPKPLIAATSATAESVAAPPLAPEATGSLVNCEPRRALPRAIAPFPSVPPPDAEAPSPSPLRDTGLALFQQRDPPLCGRTDERAALWRALRRVHDERRAGLVVLEGPAGIGKTRLADWLARGAHASGAAEVLTVEHSSIAAPHLGLTAALRRFLAADPGSALEPLLAPWGLRPLAGTLKELLASEPAPGGGMSELELRRVLIEVLRQIAHDRPVLVVIEELQRGHEALALASHALRHGGDLPVLFVATLRGEDPCGPEIERDLAALADTGHLLRLPLGALDRDDQVRLIEGLLHLDEALVTRLVTQADGNPLFAVQLLAHWATGDWLRSGSTGYTLAPDADALPPTLLDLLERRLEALLVTAPDAAALELAALMGDHVPPGLWWRACQAAGLAVDPRLLDRSTRAGLGRWRDGAWSPAPPMLRDSLRLRAERAGRLAGLHSAAADAVAELPVGETGRAERLAEHLLAAGRASEARPALAAAAQERFALSDYTACEELVGRFAGLAHRDDDHTARALLVAARTARATHRHREVTIAAARRAHARATAATRIEATIELARTLKFVGDLDEASRVVAELEASLGERQRLQRAQVLHLSSVLSKARGEPRRAIELALSGAAALDGCDEPQRHGLLSSIAVNLAALLRTVDPPRALAWARRAADIQPELVRPYTQAGAWACLADLLRDADELDEAEAAQRAAHELYRRLGSPVQALSSLNLSLLALARGDRAAAWACLEEGEAFCAAHAPFRWTGATSLLLLAMACEDGRWERARSLTPSLAELRPHDLLDPDLAGATERAMQACLRARQRELLDEIREKIPSA